MKYIDLTEVNKDVIKLVNLDDERLKYIRFISTNDDVTVFNNPHCIFQYTTKDSPFSLENSIFDSTLHINYDYFKEHDKEIMDRIATILKGLGSDEIFLSKEFITKEIVESIALNQNIHSVSLGLNGNYVLEKEIYNILIENPNIKKINTTFIDNDLEDVYDSRLTAKMHKKIGNSNLSVEDVFNDDFFTIDSRDLLEVLDVIKHRDKEKNLNRITINITDYSNLETFINYIVSRYQDIKIIFNLDFKNFDTDILNTLTNYKNIVVKEDAHDISLDLAIRKELKIREMLEPVESMKDELSPLEIYIKLYQITKEFKPYKEVDIEDDLFKSRSLSKLLFNEYIVCAGYTNLLQELCKRYEIETHDMSVLVMPNDTKDFNSVVGHARLLVKMKDDKYGIDGLYVSDPTWDSSDSSLYNHVLMTFDEIKREIKDEIPFNGYDFLNVKSKDEFYALANNPSARKKLKYLSFDIREIDKENYEKICKISTFKYDYNLENSDTLERMANYCVNFHQKIVSGYTILKALINLYKLENPEIEDRQIIEYFTEIKKNLIKAEDFGHPTIVTESENEKIYDFYDNKYNDVRIEELVTSERKNTR